MSKSLYNMIGCLFNKNADLRKTKYSALKVKNPNRKIHVTIFIHQQFHMMKILHLFFCIRIINVEEQTVMYTVHIVVLFLMRQDVQHG